jgi:hypothetical protein
MGKHIETFGGIAIHGSKDFIAEMKEALMLLQYSPSFQEVLPFLTKIDAADILSPNAVTHKYDSNKPTYNHSSIAYGGDIASLAYRSMLSRQATEKKDDAEKRCAEFRAKVERELYAFMQNDYRQSFMTWTWR